jgi:hypothetical protein
MFLFIFILPLISIYNIILEPSSSWKKKELMLHLVVIHSKVFEVLGVCLLTLFYLQSCHLFLMFKRSKTLWQ